MFNYLLQFSERLLTGAAQTSKSCLSMSSGNWGKQSSVPSASTIPGGSFGANSPQSAIKTAWKTIANSNEKQQPLCKKLTETLSKEGKAINYYVKHALLLKKCASKERFGQVKKKFECFSHLQRPVLVSLNLFYDPHHTNTMEHFAKSHMFLIQMVGISASDEKLRAVSVFPAICHGENAPLRVFHVKAFIGKFFPVYAFSSPAIVISEISSLDHKVVNDWNKIENGLFVEVLKLVNGENKTSRIGETWRIIIEIIPVQK